MKKIILFVCLMMSIVSIAQTKQPTIKQSSKHEMRVDSMLKRVDSLIQSNNLWLEQIEHDLAFKNRYKLYPTENIYNFLQLDTKTGKIEQVQWSLEDNNEGSVTINDTDLTWGLGNGSNVFELYPTKNMYQFILLEKTTGRKWHVQWGFESSKRWIKRIY